MKLRMMMAALCVAFVVPLLAQTEGTYLIRYLNNTPGSGINLTNTGSSIGLQVSLTPTPGNAPDPTSYSGRGGFTGFSPSPAPQSSDGWICANVYVLSPDEQLQECCSCPLSPNALAYLTAADLSSNTLTGVTLTNFTVKLTASVAGVPTPDGFNVSIFHTCTPGNSAGTPGGGTPVGQPTTASTAGGVNQFGNPFGPPLATGLAAWAITTHGGAVTETAFTVGQLSNQTHAASELSRLGGLCQAIVNNGSGFGICNICRAGSL